MKTTIGVQGYSVRTLLTKDETGTFQALKKIGFDFYEAMILPMSAPRELPKLVWDMDNLEEKAERMSSLGMEVPSAHIAADLKNIYLPAEEMANSLRRIHEVLGTNYFVFSIMFSTAEDAEAEGKYLYRVQKLVKEDGLQVLYHNHDMEFTPVCVDGKEMTALEYFFRFAGEDVLLELDIGWAGFAGDDLKIAKQYADRVAVLHLKDFTAAAVNRENRAEPAAEHMFTPIGSGAIHTAEIMALMEGMPHYGGLAVIDQDHANTDILDELRQGYAYLAWVQGEH